MLSVWEIQRDLNLMVKAPLVYKILRVLNTQKKIDSKTFQLKKNTLDVKCIRHNKNSQLGVFEVQSSGKLISHTSDLFNWTSVLSLSHVAITWIA